MQGIMVISWIAVIMVVLWRQWRIEMTSLFKYTYNGGTVALTAYRNNVLV